MNYRSLKQKGIYKFILIKMREKGKLFHRKECRLINAEGMEESESHHLASSTAEIVSGHNHQWVDIYTVSKYLPTSYLLITKGKIAVSHGRKKVIKVSRVTITLLWYSCQKRTTGL